MKIVPSLLASALGALAPRVLKRAEVLAEQLETPLGNPVMIGTATVSLADAELVTAPDQITCDCLLAPNCAHRAAVALRLELATAEAEDEASETPEPAPEPDEPPAADQVELSQAQRAVIKDAAGHLAKLLQVGCARMPIDLRSQLVADLHRLRSQGLVLADRSLTGVVGGNGPREARVASLKAAVLNLWQLEQAGGSVSSELVGQARQRYHQVGTLKLEPIAAIPIVAASGFSGVEVRFVDAQLRVWSLSRVLPGDSTGARTRYRTGADWGGTSGAPKDLSRARVLVGNATASASGRLGGGQAVRVTTSELSGRWGQLPDGYLVAEGPIEEGDRSAIRVAGRRLALSPAAAQLGAGIGLELLAQTGAQVRCLAVAVATGLQLLGLEPADGLIELPDSLAGVWWPGLDEVARNWVGNLPQEAAPDDADPTLWPPAVPSVGATLDRWVQRVAEGGSAVLAGDAWRVDAAWLQRAGAPFAGQLLTRLAEANRSGTRRFDGTWEPDPRALAHAWLAIAEY